MKEISRSIIIIDNISLNSSKSELFYKIEKSIFLFNLLTSYI